MTRRTPRAPLRVGSVPYLVGRPVDLGLEREPGVTFWRATPARLARGLADGSVDVALVSSIELFRLAGATWIDGPCIAGEGRVSSVQVFLRRPMAEVESVALDPASRTSAVLARVVWPSPGRPRFFEVPEGRDPRQVPADAWLRIGDGALREHLAEPSRPVLNPSQAWRARTGLPFVFALWVARPGVDLEPWAEAFARSRIVGRGRMEALALEAAQSWSLPPEVTRDYLLRECLYEPGPRLWPSLRAFRDAAAALGQARADLEPRGVPAGAVAEPSPGS